MTEENIKEKTLYEISKKAMGALGNLLDSNQIEIPIKFSDLLDLSVGAFIEAEIVDQVDIINVLIEDKDLLFDIVEFEENSAYNLHDILGQIICFRVINIMQQYLDHMNIPYENKEKVKVERQSSKNN